MRQTTHSMCIDFINLNFLRVMYEYIDLRNVLKNIYQALLLPIKLLSEQKKIFYVFSFILVILIFFLLYYIKLYFTYVCDNV